MSHARTINNGIHAMTAKPVKEPVDGNFSPAPLRRIQLAEQMNGAQMRCFSHEAAATAVCGKQAGWVSTSTEVAFNSCFRM